MKKWSEFPVPDLILREAYKRAALEVGSCREKFCARTENIELVKRYLGCDYAHVPVDDLREYITTCCKTPDKHGGGWSVVNGHGASKIETPEWYRHYLSTAHWIVFSQTVREFWEHSCAICMSEKKLEVHHRTYERLGHERINDCLLLCSKCHKRHHKYMQPEYSKPVSLFE